MNWKDEINAALDDFDLNEARKRQVKKAAKKEPSAEPAKEAAPEDDYKHVGGGTYVKSDDTDKDGKPKEGAQRYKKDDADKFVAIEDEPTPEEKKPEAEPEDAEDAEQVEPSGEELAKELPKEGKEELSGLEADLADIDKKYQRKAMISYKEAFLQGWNGEDFSVWRADIPSGSQSARTMKELVNREGKWKTAPRKVVKEISLAYAKQLVYNELMNEIAVQLEKAHPGEKKILKKNLETAKKAYDAQAEKIDKLVSFHEGKFDERDRYDKNKAAKETFGDEEEYGFRGRGREDKYTPAGRWDDVTPKNKDYVGYFKVEVVNDLIADEPTDDRLKAIPAEVRADIKKKVESRQKAMNSVKALEVQGRKENWPEETKDAYYKAMDEVAKLDETLRDEINAHIGGSTKDGNGYSYIPPRPGGQEEDEYGGRGRGRAEVDPKYEPVDERDADDENQVGGYDVKLVDELTSDSSSDPKLSAIPQVVRDDIARKRRSRNDAVARMKTAEASYQKTSSQTDADDYNAAREEAEKLDEELAETIDAVLKSSKKRKDGSFKFTPLKREKKLEPPPYVAVDENEREAEEVAKVLAGAEIFSAIPEEDRAELKKGRERLKELEETTWKEEAERFMQLPSEIRNRRLAALRTGIKFEEDQQKKREEALMNRVYIDANGRPQLRSKPSPLDIVRNPNLADTGNMGDAPQLTGDTPEGREADVLSRAYMEDAKLPQDKETAKLIKQVGEYIYAYWLSGGQLWAMLVKDSDSSNQKSDLSEGEPFLSFDEEIKQRLLAKTER